MRAMRLSLNNFGFKKAIAIQVIYALLNVCIIAVISFGVVVSHKLELRRASAFIETFLAFITIGQVAYSIINLYALLQNSIR
jgi:hypothetical protein